MPGSRLFQVSAKWETWCAAVLLRAAAFGVFVELALGVEALCHKIGDLGDAGFARGHGITAANRRGI